MKKYKYVNEKYEKMKLIINGYVDKRDYSKFIKKYEESLRCF